MLNGIRGQNKSAYNLKGFGFNEMFSQYEMLAMIKTT